MFDSRTLGSPPTIMLHVVSVIIVLSFRFLETPEVLDKECGVTGHSQHSSNRAKESDRSSSTHTPGLPDAEFCVQDAESQQRTERAGQDLAVSAIQLGDSGEHEGEWHILSKVGVSACV